MARESFSIGAFYNITKNQHNLIKTVGRDSFFEPQNPKNQDNPIKTVGRDSFLSPKTSKNTSFLGVTQPPGVAQPLYSMGHN